MTGWRGTSSSPSSTCGSCSTSRSSPTLRAYPRSISCGMELKGLILAGGAGTRLRPLTYTSAKQLVPVANKPVLFYGIEAMRDSGIEDVAIIVSPGQSGQEIRQRTGDGSRFGVRITYVEQHEPLGLAHAVLTAEEHIGDSPFVVYLGDNLLRDGISDMVEEFKSS